MDKKVEPGVFIGYNNTSKAYKIFQPQNGKILVSRDVKFMEEKQWIWEGSMKKKPPEIPQFIDDDMKSTTCYCFNFGSDMFSWSSKKQDIVAQSTTKAEYVAATTTVNQTIWLRRILADLHMEQKEPTKILVDNQTVISISNNPIFHGRTKHFKIKLFFLREALRKGEVKLI